MLNNADFWNIVVTGFEPFGEYSENSSWEVVRRISACTIDGVATQLLPVSFVRVGEALREAVAKHHPDLIVMLGQAGASDSIRLERVALNLMDSRMGDNDGFTPDEQPIYEGEESALFTSLPIKRLCESIREQGIAVKISNSAGLYVCNRTYYEGLRICRERAEMQAIFIHLPMYDGQSSAKENNPTLPLTDMVRAVRIVINEVNEQSRKFQKELGANL
jgi:pyroglutamyl-peptidase